MAKNRGHSRAVASCDGWSVLIVANERTRPTGNRAQKAGAISALLGREREPPKSFKVYRDDWLRGYDQAKLTDQDSRLFGCGYLMLTPKGCHHVPADAVTLDRAKLIVRSDP